MKRSPRVRLSVAVKRSLLPLSILSLALLLIGSPALATTPIAVDMYQDMESGNAGDVLTPSIMNASSHGAQSWSAPCGTMWVSTAYHRDLPGPVIVRRRDLQRHRRHAQLAVLQQQQPGVTFDAASAARKSPRPAITPR